MLQPRGKNMSTTYSAKQIKSAVAALNAYKHQPYVSHEWEELVFRLSHDNDPQLRERMHREMDEILEKDPGIKMFRMY
jgi:hypothetical protein